MILERRCELMLHLGLSMNDYDNTLLTELDWMYGWLVKKFERKKES